MQTAADLITAAGVLAYNLLTIMVTASQDLCAVHLVDLTVHHGLAQVGTFAWTTVLVTV